MALNKYISNNPAAPGDDLNSGDSPLLPWLTIAMLSAGAAFLTADDAAWLNRGSYFNETLVAETVGDTGGSADDHRIVYQSYGDTSLPRAIISGAEIVSGAVFDSAVAGGDRWKLVGALGYTPNYAFREDGVLGVGTVRNLFLRTSVATTTALHDWFNDVGATTVYFVLATGEVPSATLNLHLSKRINNIVPTTGGEDFLTFKDLICRFSNATSNSQHSIEWGQDAEAANGIVFDGILQEWGFNGLSFGGQGGNNFTQTRQFAMTNCVFRFNRSHGAQITYVTAGSTITFSDFSENGRQGLGFAGVFCTLDSCSFDYNARAHAKWTNPAGFQAFDAGLYLVGQSPPGAPAFATAGNNLVTRCTFKGNHFKGFATDTVCNNNRITFCISWLNEVFGFFFEGGTDSGSYGNELDHCTAWGNLNAGFSVSNSHGPFTAKNCNFYGNAAGGLASDVAISFIIINWPNHSGAIQKHGPLSWDPVTLKVDGAILTRVATLAAMTAGTWCYIVADQLAYAWKADSSVFTTAYADPPWTMNYNSYTPNTELQPGGAIMNYGSATNGFLALFISTIRSNTGQELNGIQANPLYLDAPAGDFRLSPPFSPSIDAGVEIPGINDGTGGSTRFLGSAPDIGAFEAPAITWGPAPDIVAVGVPVVNTGGPMTVPWPTSPPYQAGDWGYLVLEGNNSSAITLSTPSGFDSQILNSAKGTSTGLTGTRLQVFQCEATSGAMPDVVVAAANNHQSGYIVVVRNTIPVGNPINAGGGDVQTSTTPTVAVPGAATTVPNCRIIAIATHLLDTNVLQFTAPWANPDLSGVTEIGPAGGWSHNQGDGGGIGIATGVKATKGTYGPTTTTMISGSKQARISFALMPTYSLDSATGSGSMAVMARVSGTGFYTPPPTGAGISDLLHGSTVASLGSEVTLYDTALPGCHCVLVDLSALAVGEEAELVIYTKIGNGTYKVAWRESFKHAQDTVIVQSGPINAFHGSKAAIKQVGGTARTFKWTLGRMDT